MFIPIVFCGYTCLLGLRRFHKTNFWCSVVKCICVCLERGRKRGRETETKTDTDRQRGRKRDLMPKCDAWSSKKPMFCWSASPNWRLAVADPGFVERGPKWPGVLGRLVGPAPRVWWIFYNNFHAYYSFTWHNENWFSVDLLTFFLNFDYKRGAWAPWASSRSTSD